MDGPPGLRVSAKQIPCCEVLMTADTEKSGGRQEGSCVVVMIGKLQITVVPLLKGLERA